MTPGYMMPTPAARPIPMSSCAMALFLAVALAAPAAAQEVQAPKARGTFERRPATAADEARIVQRMEVLTKRLEQVEPGTAERRELVEELGNLMLALSELQAHRPGERVRVQSWESAPSAREHAKVMAQSRHVMVTEGMPGVPRGWVGLNVSAPHTVRLSDGEQRVRFLEYPNVVSVDPGSPADRAGIRRGDTVMAYNGTDVREEIAMGRLLRPDSRLSVRLRRDGETRDVSLVVARAPENVVVRRFDLKFPESGEFVMLEPTRTPAPPRAPAAIAGSRPRRAIAPAAPVPGTAPVVASAPQPFAAHFSNSVLLGARVEGVTREMHEATGLPRGVLVMEVAQGSPAYAAGLRPGDVILIAGGRPVQTVPALRASLYASRTESLSLTVKRKGAQRKVEVKW